MQNRKYWNIIVLCCYCAINYVENGDNSDDNNIQKNYIIGSDGNSNTTVIIILLININIGMLWFVKFVQQIWRLYTNL